MKDMGDRLFISAIVGFVVLAMATVGVREAISSDQPIISLNGADGTFLLALALLALLAHLWRPLRSFSASQDPRIPVSLHESCLLYSASIFLGGCLIGFAALGL